MKSLPSGWKYSIGLIVSILLLFAANLWVGSVRIPAGAVWDILCGHAVERESWRFILLESRIPQGITALLCGAALAVSGLMLQTVFSNPLAGPSILGINTGASLGVALVMLLGGGSITAGVFSISGFLAVLAGAFAGAMIVMGILLFFSAFTKNNLMLLIEFFLYGRRSTFLYDLGIGKFQRSVFRAIACIYRFDYRRFGFIGHVDQTFECLIVGKPVC